MAAPTNAANVKKALANPEPSTHGHFSDNAGQTRRVASDLGLAKKSSNMDSMLV
jgi:hypothetical protein